MIILGRPFYALISSIEVVELVKISQRYTRILSIPSYGYMKQIRVADFFHICIAFD